MLFRSPGIKAGSRVPGNIYLLDFLATLCDLAGIPVPATNEGRSLRPVLEGRAATVRDAVYGVYCGGTRPGIRAVRQGDWKLIQYDVHDGRVRETQLFNLRANPEELLIQHRAPEVVALTGHSPTPEQTNLAGDPRHAAKLRELRALVDQWVVETKDQGDRSEDPLDIFKGYNNRLPDEPAAPKAGKAGKKK